MEKEASIKIISDGNFHLNMGIFIILLARQALLIHPRSRSKRGPEIDYNKKI
jgi:hypothetical protein